MIKTKVIVALIGLSSVMFFDSCKKGEDDPFLSFRSRKGRVAGEWKMTDYKAVDSDGSGTTTITSNGSTYTVANQFGSFTGTLTWEGEFDKDGKYKYTRIEDGDAEVSEGTWNFTAGVGELKKKSQITIYETSYASGGTSATWTGNYVDRAYDLKELRHKKMVWYSKVTSSQGGFTSTFEETITWEAK
jgi:hypothetical protein